MKPSTSSSPRLLLLSVFFFLASPTARADVILHPGVLAGTVTMDGWTFGNSNVFLGGNTAGYTASASFQGSSFALTTEGDQSYSSLSISQSFAGGSFYLVSSASYFVPAHGHLDVAFTRPGGTLLVRFHVTGGELVSASHQASASNAALHETYQSYANVTSSGEGSLPIVAGATVTLNTTATVVVHREDGSVLCTTSLTLPQQQVVLSRGEVRPMMHELPLSPDLCARQDATLSGVVKLEGLPSGVDYPRAYLSLYGPISQYAQVTNSAPTYRFSDLPAGDYHLYVDTSFTPTPATGGPSGTLALPGRYTPVHLDEQAQVVRDVRVQGILANGAFLTAGYAFTRLISQGISFNGVYDPALPGGGPTYGGYASFEFKSPSSREYQAVLTPGRWTSPVARFVYEDTTQRIYLNYSVRPDETFLATEGGPMTLPTATLSNSPASVVFDVIEPDGDPEKLISDPYITAQRVHPLDHDSISVWSQRFIQNKARPSVMIIGPRGTYTFEAHATIDGSAVTFARSRLEIGTPVPTPSGPLVQVSLQDGMGATLPSTLQFESVEQSGDTSASMTTTGPEPADGYKVVEIVDGVRFLSLYSSAAFSGEVLVSVDYDPARLNLSPEQEKQLELQQFVCNEDTPDDSCRWVRIGPSSVAPEREWTPVRSSAASHTITGRTSTLGLVALMLPKPRPPQVTCLGAAGAPVLRQVAPGTCGLLVDAASGLAGSCFAGSSALASCTLDGSSSLILGTGPASVVVSATGTDGLSTSCTSYLAVVSPDPLTISLNEEAQQPLECGLDTYVDPGAQAWDGCGHPLDVLRYNSGADPYGPGPNTAAEGTYSVQYSAWDAAGKWVNAIRTVRVDDRTPPTLTLKGDAQVTHTCGSAWADPGVEALDACYGDVSATASQQGGVNSWAEGTYTVTYRVTDSGGNSAPPVTRTVKVVNCPWNL